MANVIQHLEAVSTGYKVFEDNQVLTKEPLNALVDYLDDQERLTRVALLGVGIIGGLRVSVSNDVVVLTKGVGVTTDGDLLRVPIDLEYTRFRAYDETAPKYDRLYDGQNMLKVFELVGEEVDTAATLGTFNADTGKKLEEMVAVLLMESFLKDQDLCTGGDCDNKGKDSLSNVKLLVLDKNDIGLLEGKIATLDNLARALEPAFADRVVLNAQITTAAAMTQAYRTAANATRDRLKIALQKVFLVATELGEVFTSNPTSGWIAKLDTAVPDSGIQAFYDFLRDVVDALNALGESLAGETSILCPALNLFPKHLLLGVVGEFSLPPELRMGLYPSPLVRAAAEAVDRARFFARRLDTLITSFTSAVNAAAPVTVTPSQTPDRPLDERAIPTYYAVNMNAPRPIHIAWSYTRARRGMAQFNYSANGQLYGAKGAAIAPLTARIDAFTFLRIEGHLGKPVGTVVTQIETKITQSNLPFAVRAVLLGGTRPQIVVKPPIRYTDLHRVHHLLRHDLTLHLDEVMAHTNQFKVDVDLALEDNLFDDRAAGQDISIKGFAEETRQKVQTSATGAKTKLAQPYSQYRAATPWHDDMKETMTQAYNMRMTLRDVSRTEIVSPLDSLVANKHALWAEWLDAIIAARNDQDDDKLLFTNFIAKHPSAEHAGGVERGGTFVLVYDSSGTVVADVSLPYHWPESAEPEPEQNPLPPPKSRPTVVVDKGWRLLKPTYKLVLDNINIRFDDFQRNYLQAIKDSVQIFTPIKDLTGGFTAPLAGFDDKVIRDPGLRVQLQDTVAKSDRVQQIRKLLVTPGLDAVKRTQLEQLLKAADHELGESIKETTKVVTGAGIEVETEGAAALAIVANAFAHLTGPTAGGVAKTMRTQAGAAGVSTGARALMGAVLKGSGLKL